MTFVIYFFFFFRKLYVQSEPYEEELTCMGLFRNESKLVVGSSKGRLYTYNWDEFGLHSNMFPGSYAYCCSFAMHDAILLF